MIPIDPLARRQGEGRLQYLAFQSFIKTRKLPDAYRDYMQTNVGALTSEITFYKWSERFAWSERLRDIDIDNELRVRSETRRKGLDNLNTSEDVARELMATCLDEFDLRRGDLTHKDIGKYFDVAVKITDRWVDRDAPQVVVNVDSSATATVEVSDEVLRELGKKMSEEQDANSD